MYTRAQLFILLVSGMNLMNTDLQIKYTNGTGKKKGAFSFVPHSEFVGRPSWTKSGP